ncbi:MAG: hypothetical protein ACRCZQ_11975 [Bacteroidales bacterium]
MKTILSLTNIRICLGLLLGIVFFSGCTSDSKELSDRAEQAVKLGISAINPANADNLPVSVSNYRLILAEKNSEYILLNQSTLDNSLQVSLANQIQVTIKPGSYTAYLIANESGVMTLPLSSAKFLKEVRELVLEPMSWNSLSESDIPMMAVNQIQIRAKDNLTNAGEVSDNGGVWQSSYDALLERVFAKVSLRLNKGINYPISIESVKIRQIAKSCYLGKLIFDTPQTMDIQTFTGTPIDLPFQNGTNYQSIFESKVISERLFADITNQNKAYIVDINARFNSIPTQYNIPLGNKAGSSYSDYQVKRNVHYLIQGTISEINDFNNNFTVEVLPWEKESSNVDFNSNISFSLKWNENTSFINSSQIQIGSADIAQCDFVLNTPRGKRWTATLSNGADFEFDSSGNGVSQGISGADNGRTSRIRIKAKQKMSVSTSTTLTFYLEDGRIIPVNPANGNVYTIILKAE